MTPLFLVRHGPTAWNEDGRIQGHADIELSPNGRREVASWQVPPAWATARWLVSPLRRAQQTAALLTDRPVAIDSRLIEMNWGAWEGQRLADLRTASPAAMAANEAQGLDFRPSGGESPREVAVRIQEMFAALADAPPVVAVTHKGVMRAALALATGWQMHEKAPVRLGRGDVLALTIAAGGQLTLGTPLSLAA
jgi:probable phosphoglycerate mutase